MEGNPISFEDKSSGDAFRRRVRSVVLTALSACAFAAMFGVGQASAVTVVAGDTHTCATARSGDVFCWGSNANGQLGDGTTTTRNGPVKLAAPADVTALAVGGSHTCALVVDGSVYCWGANAGGQLGDGTTTQSLSPVAVSGLSNVGQIAAGTSHTCALVAGGSVYCWGDNTNGRLGDGTTTQRSLPVAVSGIAAATSLSVGDAHACVVEGGAVKCWGLGTSGQLGNGIASSSSTPVSVSGVSGAQQVTAGGSHSCARVSGAVKCWGLNTNGQLGDGTTTSPRPTAVTAGSLSGVTQLAAGGNHTCAADSTPQVTCWGVNTNGQLGDNSTTQRSTPTAVSGLTSLIALSAGSAYTCAVAYVGLVQCWGAGAGGQIGDDGAVQRLVPATVPRLAGGRGFATGQAHTCTSLSSGNFWCWGTNGAGQLGDGTSSLRPLPVRNYFANDAFAVTGGQTHTCAALAGGQAKCWGSDGNGQLGDDAALVSKNLPVNVSGLSTAIRIAAGNTHTCAIVSGGQAKCWGSDGNLQLGDDAVPSAQPTPVNVAGLTNATEISAGGTTSCAIVSGGQAKCWGNNTSGQIGNGNNTNQSSPANVSGVTNAVVIANGLSHACAIISGGTVKCWGSNTNGQLGNNSTTDSNVPVTVTGVSGATAIDAGDYHTCAVVTLGAVKCWGAGTFGQLGDGLSTQSLVAVNVSGLLGVTTVATGQNHACAIEASGRETCWGYAAGHQLGNGSTSNRSTPFEIESMLEGIVRFDSITEGEFIQNAQPTISFSTADVISPLKECNLDGGGWNNCFSSYTPAAPLALGHHTLQVRASGSDFIDGPISVSSLSFSVAVQMPTMTINSPSSGAYVNSGTPVIAFSATGQGGLTTTCQIDSGTFNACASPYTAPSMGDGAHTVTVKVVDGNANVATAAVSLTVDTVAPNTSITANPPALSNSAAASFSFSAGETATFECNLDGGGWSSCSSPKAYGSLSDGVRGFQVRAIDTAGNVDSTPANYGWTVDTTPPNTSITANPPAATNATSASFSFSATETATFECNLDGGGWSSCSSPKAYASLSAAAHTFQVRATDTAGNVDATPASYGWTIDTTPPNTSITANPAALSNSASASFSFSATETATFECNLDGGGWSSCSSPKTYASLSAAAHSFQVRATDTAGNVDATPASYGWTIDLTPPDTSISANPAALSNSSSANFSFSATETATFECNLDGGGWLSCSSPKAYVSLSAAAHTFQVRATDTAGNADATPATYGWTIDLTPPDTSITANPAALSNSANASFSFSATESATFECRLDAGGWSSCSSPKPYTALADATHTFYVRATDTAGNVDASPASYVWAIDTASPDTSITANPAALTNSAGANFSFSATETSTFECNLDGGGWSSCASPKSYASLSAAAHTFQVRATDTAGNTDATPASYSWTVDTTPPNTSITASPAVLSNSAAASFSFSATETSTFECNLDGGGWSSCTSPKAYASLSAAAHTFQVRATDTAGNADATPATYGWTIDTVAPNTTIDSNPPAMYGSTSAIFSFSADETATFECRIDAGAWGGCTSSKSYTSLTQTSHTFDVRATDGASNVDPTPATYSWTVDTTTPVVAVTSPANNSFLTVSPAVQFSVTEVHLGATTCSVDGGTASSCSSPFATSLAQGAHSVVVQHTDQAGNLGSATVNFTLDWTAPNTSFSATPSNPSAVANPSFSFNSSEGTSSFQCRIDGGAWGACVSPKNYAGLSEGSHTVQVYATDQSGNADATPASYTWTVDTVAPVVAVSAPVNGSTTGDSTPTVSFTITDAGATAVLCRIDSGSWQSCASPFTTTTLLDGAHSVSVSATDGAGNPGSASVGFTVDSTYPTMAISAPASGSLTADPTPTVTFGATGSSITTDCKVDSGLFAACASGGSLATLADGPHTLIVRATDSPLARVAMDSVSFTVDATAPVVSISSPSVGATLTTLSPSIAFSVVDLSAVVVTCAVDGGAYASCASPLALTLTAGSHGVSVRGTDAAGNQQSQTVNFTLTAPVPP
ncbi:MAG: hypothetical protein HY827_04025, partial [Actinobacteria bacterium]|nr:hypothetical protein [Actinomycetota bacterium]